MKAAEAREKAAPLLAEGRATAADKASVAAALAAERAAEGRDLAVAKVNELRGIEPEPKGGKLKKFLLLGGLLAIGGVVFSKLRAKQDAERQLAVDLRPAGPAEARVHDRLGDPAAHARLPGDHVGRTGGDPLTDPLPDEVTADDVVTVDPPATDDIGGGAPGEAISDSVEDAARGDHARRARRGHRHRRRARKN